MKKSYKLTQKQYEYIVEQCDGILRKYQSDTAVVGIAWLHVLNSHPTNQTKYKYVFNKRNFGKSLIQFFGHTGFLLGDLFLSLFSFLQKNNYRGIAKDNQLLFISHLLNPKATRTEPDFYYRELPEYMQSHGYETTVAIFNHTKDFKGWHDIPTKTEPKKILMPRRLGFVHELSFLVQAVGTSFFFMKQYFAEKDALQKSFLSELIRNIFSRDTIRTSRTYQTIRYILDNTNTRLVTLTWEGHSWERLVCYAANHAKKKVASIGYQHTILFPGSHALKRHINKAYEPGLVLSVGSVTKEILSSSGIDIVAYGSPRLKEKNVYSGSGQIKNGCLVAPEGLAEQSIILFVFALAAAKAMPGINFIFRMYPGIPFESVQSKDKRLQELPSNVIISTFEKMEDDFKRCSWLLYRSTSVSLFAVLAGLRPLYLQLPDEFSVDPLYTLDTWRLNVTEPQELVNIINHDKHAPAHERSAEIKDAIVFCENYMTPYNMPLFEKIVQEEISIQGPQ